MQIRREAAVVESIERYRRQEVDHPNRKIIEEPRPPKRIKKKSIMSVAEELREKFTLPEDREPIYLFDANYNFDAQKKTPHIRKVLTDNVSKKQSDILDLRSAALRTIDQYSDDIVHIYTDGSASCGTRNAGYGVCMLFPDGTCREFFGPCGKFCTNYEAEAVAIETSLNEIGTIFSNNEGLKKDVVIFTDAMSVLQALENYNIKDRKINNLSLLISQVTTSNDIDITLQWVPGHTNLPGNDRADILAKSGANSIQTETQASLDTAKQTIKQLKKKEWLSQWEQSNKGRRIYQHMSSPNPKDEINKLKRNEQCNIFRLRSGHIQLNSHLHKIGVKMSSACPLCGCPEETVSHHLFVCTALEDLRREYLPPKPDTTNTLYGSENALRDTHTFHVMATHRRARAQ